MFDENLRKADAAIDKPVDNTTQIRCKNCGTVIIPNPRQRHTMQFCSCFKNEIGNKGIAIDAESHYTRYIGDMESFEFSDDGGKTFHMFGDE